MAQTKRKRRTKHRGTAAGTVEARGRTGRKPTPQERGGKTTGAQPRQVKPPTWRTALTKAAMMAALLFLLTRLGLFGRHVPIGQSAVLACFAVIMYTPLAYMTDKWVYSRQQRRQAAAPPKR